MRKGFTIIELLVVVSIIGLLVAILLPAIGKARESALLTQSQSNLRSIGTASGVYGADFQDRQWTAVSDDLGQAGTCDVFSKKRCSAQLTLGYKEDGSAAGFFIPQAASCGVQSTSANCQYAKAYWPCDFNMAGTGNFGSWRLVNAKSFNKYVSARFYDPIFYAPKDKVTLEKASAFLETGADFSGTLEQTVLSTYCWSPAAMWGTEVLSKKNGFKAPPSGSPAGFRSPSAGQASFPDLKTRCLEHQWLQNKPNLDTMDGGKWSGNSQPNKDSFCPATRGSGGMPWVFNQGYQSAPVSVFFDGHIAQLGVAEAADSWSRVAFGDAKDTTSPPKITGTFVAGGSNVITGMPSGYTNGATYDNGAEFSNKFVSYHVLTAGGIQGRDTIGQK